MIVHIEQLDGDMALAAPALAFAHKELRKWAERPEGSYNRTYPVLGGNVRLRQVGDLQYIAIAVGGAYFEFETSGSSAIFVPFEFDGVETVRYKTGVVAATPSVTDGKIVLPVKLLSGKRVEDASKVSRIGRPQHRLLYDEPVRGALGRSLFETWAPGHSHTGIHFRSYSNQLGEYLGRYDYFHYNIYRRPFRGSYVTHALRELSQDMPYGETKGASAMSRAFVRGDADYPRASGTQTTANGTYGIVIDSFCQVHIFPKSTITAVDGEKQNVTDVKTAKIPLPDWVYQPSQKFSEYYALATDPNNGLIDLPDIDWKLNPDGTKACAVVYQRVPATFDVDHVYDHQADGGPDRGTISRETFIEQFNANTGRLGVGGRFAKPIAEDRDRTRWQCGTGLVEVDIAIDDKGAPTLTVREVRIPTESPYCTMMAGYVSDTFGGAVRGDLVTLDIERYVRKAEGVFAFGSFFSLKRLTAGDPIELRSFGAYVEAENFNPGSVDAEGILGAPAVLVACDMATLSFAVKQTYVINTVGDVKFSHFGVSIYTLNEYRETLFPETLTLPDAVTAITTDALAVGRDFTSKVGLDWERYDNNDSKTWADFDADVRDPPFPDPPVNVGSANWLRGLCGFVDRACWVELAYPQGNYGVRTDRVNLGNIINPKFGWLAYTCELCNRLGISPLTTFYADKSGSWAFFDRQFVYSKYGTKNTGNQIFLYPLIGNDVGDVLETNAGVDVALFEHAILDRVSYINGTLRKDTTFVDLYNEAIKTAETANVLEDDLVKLSKAAMRVTITNDPDGGVQGDPHLGFSGPVPDTFWYGYPKPPDVVFPPRPPDTETAMRAAGGQFLWDVYRAEYERTGPYYPRAYYTDSAPTSYTDAVTRTYPAGTRHFPNVDVELSTYRIFSLPPGSGIVDIVGLTAALNYSVSHTFYLEGRLVQPYPVLFITAYVFSDNIINNPLPADGNDGTGGFIHWTNMTQAWVRIENTQNPALWYEIGTDTAHGIRTYLGAIFRTWHLWYTDADIAAVQAVLASLGYTPPPDPLPNTYPQPAIGSLSDLTLHDVFYNGPLLSSPREAFGTSARPITFANAIVIN